MFADYYHRIRDRTRRHYSYVALNFAVLAFVAAVYLTNRLFLKGVSSHWFLHFYLNDLFAMPFILAYSNLLILAVGRFDLRFRSLLSIAALTTMCALAWEFIAPVVNSKAVFDQGDFLAYAVGALAYYVLQVVTRPTVPTYDPTSFCS